MFLYIILRLQLAWQSVRIQAHKNSQNVCLYHFPGGVVVRPWAHNRKVVSSSLAHAPVEMWCSYSFSITMWCEKSIQHQPTSSPSCKWEPGIFWGANSLAISHTPAWFRWDFGAHTSGWERWSVLLRVPSQAPGVCSTLAPSACLMHRQPGSAR